MKEPIDYKKYTEQQKQSFVILNYLGIEIIREGKEQGWTNGDWFKYPSGGCGVTMYGTSDQTYAKIIKDMLSKPYGLGYKYITIWGNVVLLINKLRSEKETKQAFKNQLKQIDYYLNYLNIEKVIKYVVGAINVLNGKKGAYPI